MYNILSFTKKF